MLALRETRAKDAFSLLLSWIDPEDDIHHNLTANHFQDGLAAMQQLDQEMDIAILRSDMRDLDKKWMATSITADVGVNAN